MAATRSKSRTRARPNSASKTTARRKQPSENSSPRHRVRKWSQDVTRHSNAMDLEPDVFTFDDPKEIAASLKRSAERSRRRKSPPFRSAMSMLTFYVNRAGGNLPAERRRILERAKDELRIAFGKAT